MLRASFFGALLLFVSCARETPPPAVASSPAAAPAKPAPADALAAMDKRAPVPLLPMMANHQKRNMRDHLVAVQEIVAALAAEDFPAVEKAAARIGYSAQMSQMCTHMGAGAPGFTEQALAFHRTADGIGEAARKRDKAAALLQLGATLRTCTACHEAWRQELVNEETWTRLTETAAPAGHDMR